MTFLGVIFGLITLLFGLLNMPSVQEYARNRIVLELQNKLGTELVIGKLYFQPFNSIRLDSVYLYGLDNKLILGADKIDANFDLFHLLSNQLVFTSVHLSDFDIYLSKKASGYPMNIQFIIDAFKTNKSSEKQNIQVKINTLSIVDGRFHYDLEDKPGKVGFDPNHILVSDIDMRLSLKSLVSDSLNIQIKRLRLKEKSGLEITDMSGRLITQNKKAFIKGFELELPGSKIQLDKFEVDYSAGQNFDSFTDAQIDCVLSPSYISLRDISAFSSQLSYFKDKVNFKGHFLGTLNDIAISDLSIWYGDNMRLVANAEIKDFRNNNQTYILGTVDTLTLTSVELERVLNNLSKDNVEVSPFLTNLGKINFHGDVSGYLKQMTAFGSIETDQGILRTDVLFGFKPNAMLSSFVKGKIYTSNFNLSKTFVNKDLGEVSLNLSVDIEKPNKADLRGNAKGTISEFDYRGHTYKDITLDADYDGLKVNGNLNINDPNGLLAVNGLFDLSDKTKPKLDFTAKVKDVQLDSLHIADKLKQSYLSFIVRANFEGRNIDDAEGYIRIDSLNFIREDRVFDLNQFFLEASGVSSNRKLKIKSDIVNGEILGGYAFTTIIKSVQNTVQPYLPALISAVEEKKGMRKQMKANNLSFDIRINNTEKLSSILKLPVTVVSQAKIVGFYNDIYNKFRIEVFTPVLKAGGMNIKSGYVLAENPNGMINSKINLYLVNKNNVINDISVNTTAYANIVNTNISIINDGKQKLKGNFALSTLFTKENKDPLRIDIDMLPSDLVMNNELWNMDESHITLHNKHITVNNFKIYNKQNGQLININGKYSPENSKDILKTELRDIDLGYIFNSLAIDAVNFGGATTGDVMFSSVEGKPYANTRLRVKNFSFNDTKLGELDLFSELDDETNIISLDGKIKSKEDKTTFVKGEIDPINQKLSFNFDADSLDISFLSYYAESIFNKLQGRGTGKVHLFGDFSNVTVEGKAYIKDGVLGISFLNTDYTFSDTIFMKKDLIYFNNIKLYDKNNNIAFGSGKVVHDYFHDFMYYIELNAQNFLVYDAKKSQNPIFWGQAYGTGKGSISGNEEEVNINVSMRTEKNTVVRMNFMDETVNEYSFITFKGDSLKNDSINSSAGLKPIETKSSMAINMNFYIDATPEATAELVMDPIGGDILRGSGSGALQFTWSTTSSPHLYGTYYINMGSYNFTFQRLMERKFTIEDGSSIQFRGDPFGAMLNVSAIYKVTANLNDLDRALVESTGQSNIPVNCVLNLSGILKHPTIGLDIRFPSADPEVARQIKNLMNTEDMINKQVAYLLILSKFYTPSDADINHKTSDFAAVASATLSNQLTKIVSQIDSRWQLGTNIRTSDSQFTSTEVELLLSSQLLNNRLLINGNFGYRDDPSIQIQDAFITDIDIEYLLNNSGTWRIKAYNHFNEKFYYKNPDNRSSVQTQGVGIMYKKDFDKFRELFPKVRTKLIFPRRKEKIVPDSTSKGSSISHFIKMKE